MEKDKMFKNEADFRKTVSRLNIDAKPNDAHRENLRREMLSAFRETRRPGPAEMPPGGRWQNVMHAIHKSRITKLAAAAVILVAVIIGLRQYTPSVGLTAPAFGQVMQNMQQRKWIYFFVEDHHYGVIEYQYWISPTLQRILVKGRDGWAVSYDWRNKLSREYRPSENRITVSYLDRSFLGVFQSIVAKDNPTIDNLVKRYRREDAYIVRTNARYNDRDAIVYQCEVFMPSRGKQGIEKSTWVVDAKTHLPIIYEVDGKTRWAFDYPDTAPADIYELGAPESAEVIEEVPSAELTPLLDAHREHKNRLSRYGAILMEGGLPKHLICREGERLRVERLDVRDIADWQQNLDDYRSQMGDTFQSVLRWILNSGKPAPLHLELYDGVFTYLTYHRDMDAGKPAGRYRNRPLANEFEFRTWLRIPLDGHIVQNEYSKENHLICVQNEHSRTYVNPARDYTCHRTEFLSGLETRQVLEYERTESGYWYPKKIRMWVWYEDSNGFMSDKGRPYVVTVFLDTDFELLDSLLDPTNLPNYVHWHRTSEDMATDTAHTEPNEVLEYQGLTPLHLAAFTGNTGTAGKLLAEGGRINPPFDAFMTPIELAASAGNLEMVKLLHRYGADIKGNSEKEHSPLAAAARQGHFAVAKYLLENGADVDAAHRSQHTPLHYAALAGDLSMISLLLQWGAQVDAKNTEGATPLREAVRASINPSMTWCPEYDRQHERYVKVAKMLIEAGGDVNARDRDGRTPLLYLANTVGTVYHLNVGLYKLLIDSGADVDVKAEGSAERTPLILAVKADQVEIAEILLEAGADPLRASPGDHFQTALEIAKYRAKYGRAKAKADEMVVLLQKYVEPRLAEIEEEIKTSVREFVEAVKQDNRKALMAVVADHLRGGKGIWNRWADQIRKHYQGHYELLDDIVGMKTSEGWAGVLFATPEDSGMMKHIYLLLMQFPDGKWRVLEFGESNKDREKGGGFYVREAIIDFTGYRKAVFETAGKIED
jgi:ankyrin repeat protein